MTSSRSQNIAVDALYVSLFDEIDMGVYVLDSEDRFIYASPDFERITGLGTDAVLGSHYSAIISPEDRGRAERCSGDGHDRPVRCEVAVIKNDGP